MGARHQQSVVFQWQQRPGRGCARAMSGCTSRALWSPTPLPTIPTCELKRLTEDAVDQLRVGVDKMLDECRHGGDKEQLRGAGSLPDVCQLQGLDAAHGARHLVSGLSAEAAVEKEQSTARTRMEQVN